jgi:hypothetical protein
VWQAQSSDFPEGGTIARSGRLYLTLGGASQILMLSPGGSELARYPKTSADNSNMQVPLNEPATIAFAGNDALITNHAYTGYSPQAWAILAFHAGEPGAPLFYPIVRPFASPPVGTPRRSRARPVRIRLTVRPKRVLVGRGVRFRFSATFVGAGRRRALRGGLISFAGRRRRTDARGRVTIVVRLNGVGAHRARIRAPGLLDGVALVHATRRRR